MRKNRVTTKEQMVMKNIKTFIEIFKVDKEKHLEAILTEFNARNTYQQNERVEMPERALIIEIVGQYKTK